MKSRIITVLMILAMVASLCAVMAAPASAGAPTSVAVTNMSTHNASQASSYEITITVATALSAGSDDIIITFPAGTVVPSSIYYQNVTVASGGSSSNPASGGVNVAGNVVTITTPVAVAASGTVVVTFSQVAGIVNPQLASNAGDGTTYQIAAHTSQDTTNALSAAYAINAWITATPMQLAYQDPVTVTGAGFKPGYSIELVVTGGAVGLTPGAVESDGTFELTGFGSGSALPISVKDGSGRTAATSTSVTLLPRLSVSPTSGVVGSTITITAYDISGSPTAIYLAGSKLNSATWTQAYLWGQMSDVDGDLATDDLRLTTTIPSGLASGDKQLLLTQTGTGQAMATFTVASRGITVDPMMGPGGTNAVVSGVGFAPNTTYTCSKAGMQGIFFVISPSQAFQYFIGPSTIQTDGNGAFVAPVTIPQGVTAGAYGISVILGTNMAQGLFTVTPTSLTVEPASGPIGTKFTVSGGEKLLGTSGTLALQTTNGMSWSVVVNQPGGSITPKTITSQSSYTGGYAGFSVGANTLVVTSHSASGTTTATASVEITRPTCVFTPDNAARGAQIVVTGEGWYPGAMGLVTIKLNGTTVAYATPGSDGSIYQTFKASSSLTPGSTVTYQATDSLGNTSLLKTFKIGQAEIALDPTSGAVGTQVTITGTGFMPLTGIDSIQMNGINVVPAGTVLTDASGGFSATFTVPGFDTGGYAVNATMGSETASTSFLINAGGAAATTVASGFASIDGKYTKIWTFDGATQTWQVFDTAEGAPDDFTTLTSGQGYFVEVTEDCTLTYGAHTYNLSAGWNSIGWQD